MKRNKRSETAIAEAAALPRTAANEKPAEETHTAGKMTIYEYEEKYVKRQNTRAISFFLVMIVALIGLFFFWCFFSISKQVWDMNEYAGYAAIGVSVLLFILLYIVPVVKIFSARSFVTNVNYKTAAKAKRRNKRVRYEIAAKIVDLTNNVAGVGWYDGATVAKLEAGVKFRDDGVIKEQLTALYRGSVKKSAKELIFKCSMRSAMYSALSQESKIDAMLIAVVNLQLIKDITFLYGFRPSEARLVRIFASVVRNSLVAYGLGGIKIGNGVVRTMGDAAKGIPLLGTLISTLVDSSVQGLANGTLTAVIGFQTIKYLNTEYKLQNILDGVEIAETEEELNQTCNRIESELKKRKHPDTVA